MTGVKNLGILEVEDKMNREYKRDTVEYYTDENKQDIYVYSTFVSVNGCKTQTFLNEKNSVRNNYLCNTIEDLIKNGAKVFRIVNELENHQIGDNIIHLEKGKWTKKDIKRNFKYKSVWDKYICELFVNPKTYRLHLEYEIFKTDKFMSIKPDIYNITLYDIISIRYHWNNNNIEIVHSSPISKNSGRLTNGYYINFNSTIEDKEFYEDKIKAINYYYAVYEHYKNECLPDIIEHIL